MDRTLPEDTVPHLERKVARRLVRHSNKWKQLRQGVADFTGIRNPERAVEYEIKEHRGIQVRNPATGGWFRFPDDHEDAFLRGKPITVTERQLLMKHITPRYLYKRAKRLLKISRGRHASDRLPKVN